MQKFLVLLKKEIRELITLRLILPLLIMTMVFGLIGQIMNDQSEEIKAPLKLAVVDDDQSQISRDIITHLSDQNFVIKKISGPDPVTQTKNQNLKALMMIPKNFAQDFQDFKKPEIKFYTFTDNFSLLGLMQGSKVGAVQSSVQEMLSNQLIRQNTDGAEPQILKNPIQAVDFVVIKDRSAQISFMQLTSFIQSQTTFVPIILFMIIVIASQMVATTIATEKESKTLEILLSSPINRKLIVFTKILASGIVALLFCLVYMLGFKSYMGGMMGSIGGDPSLTTTVNPALSQALQELGVVINGTGYLLLGLSLFLSILCALAIAIILGILAEDVKGVQTVITPLMVLILIPYFITMFADINSFSPLIRYIIYAIPFSHPFLAMKNVILQEYDFVIFGIIYQAIVFFIFVMIAARIFSSDRILTFKLSLKKKK